MQLFVFNSGLGDGDSESEAYLSAGSCLFRGGVDYSCLPMGVGKGLR